MSVINTNINALAAQGSLSNVTKKQQTAMERLSTGLRINSAKDDAAGLSITNRMTSQIRGYAVAIRNSNDGISMTQTAEGALGQIGDMLQRMRELAVQSSNGSNSADNRAAIQAEVLQLKNEINNIATKTNHNDIKLLNGSAGDIVLQTGVNTGDTMSLKFESAQAKDLGIGSPLALTSLGKSTTALSRGDILINGVHVDASIAQDDSLSYAGNSGSAIAKAAAINKVSDLTGVVATVGKTVVYGSTQATTAAVVSGTISINGVATSTIAFGSSESTDLARSKTVNAINAISAQTGVKALDGGDANHGVILVAEDGRNITVSHSASGILAVTGVRTESTTTLATATSYVGTYSLTSVDGSDISLSSRVGGTIANADFYTGTYKANVAQFVSAARAASIAAPTALSGSDIIINGVAVNAAISSDDTATFATTTSATKASSAIATAAAINRVKDLTGVTAKANANILVGTGFATGVSTSTVTATSMFLNGVTISANVTADTTRADLVNLINLKTGQTGVVASDNGDGLTLVAADGRTISLGVDNGGTAGSTAVAAIGMANINGSTALATSSATTGGAMAFISTVSLESDKAFKIESGSAGNTNFGLLGFIQGTYGGSSDMLNVEHLDVSTQSGAMVAIKAIDSAIDQISLQQSRAGAYQNRLDSVVSNLTESNQNMSASRSRILDTDYAQETTNLAKSQIISQAATAMLAQANQAGQSVLALLK